MTFKSKRDLPVFLLLVASIIVIAIALLTPVVLHIIRTDAIDWILVILLIIGFAIVSGILIWNYFDIYYEFRDDYLIVKNGIFKSKIPYNTIKKVKATKRMFTGYRANSSRDALEIEYSYGMGSVVISPEHKDKFIAELMNRSPQAVFYTSNN